VRETRLKLLPDFLASHRALHFQFGVDALPTVNKCIKDPDIGQGLLLRLLAACI
jgi:hypothetical protein